MGKDPTRSILISTQHIEEANFIGDRVCILKDGIVAACDTPWNLKKMFSKGYTIKLDSDKIEL